MNAVTEDIKELVTKELASANATFPLFSSSHEGYAVIKEETEELEQELSSIQYVLEKMLWKEIKKNSKANTAAEMIKQSAILAACEAVQVAAMAQKYIDSMEYMESENE